MDTLRRHTVEGMADLLRKTWVEQVMGLPVSLLARGSGSSSPEAQAAVDRVFAELREVDARFSLYREDSELSRIRRAELTLADAHDEVREVAARCERATELTGGLFDPRTPEGVWDPSGLVKGWAAQRAARHLEPVPQTDWCLNAGGDVVVLAQSGHPFTVGIQDPTDDKAVLTALTTGTAAVATSGTGARGAHLYDPRTGRSAAGPWLSVTVTGPSLELADVLATAAFVAGEQWDAVLTAVPGYGGLAVGPGRELRRGTGWPG